MNDAVERIGSMKGQWAGDIASIDNSNWAKITKEWKPREERGNGAD